jgi:hypothetical protein
MALNGYKAVGFGIEGRVRLKIGRSHVVSSPEWTLTIILHCRVTGQSLYPEQWDSGSHFRLDPSTKVGTHRTEHIRIERE